jgi:xylulokinase
VALWLGLDLGTSAAKGLLVDETGTVRTRATAALATTRASEGIAEQDPDTYLAAAADLIRGCSAAGRPDAVGLCGQTPTLVFMDGHGKWVRPAITWQDVRAQAEAAELQRLLGDPRPHFGIDLPWSPVYPAAKLRWLADHEPETVQRTSTVLSPKDVVGAALTDSAVSDLWSCRALRNLSDGQPASLVLEAAGWGDSVVPDVAAAWTSRGRVTRAAAARFGLPADIPVSVGWTDALSAMLAVGVFDEPRSFVISGTADIVGRSLQVAPADVSPLLLVPRTCAPLPVVYGPIQSTGAALSWLRAILGEARGDAPGSDHDHAATPGSDGPTFVPYLAGERAPIWRDDVRGLFVGLRLEHGAPELLAAVEVGIACADRDVLESADNLLGEPSAEISIAGATAAGSSEQRAAVLGRAVAVLREHEASALGAAMLAAAAAGEPLEDVARRMRGPVDRFVPNVQQIRGGDVAFARYRRARDVALAWADAERVSLGSRGPVPPPRPGAPPRCRRRAPARRRGAGRAHS